jgi:hypothetical protein
LGDGVGSSGTLAAPNGITLDFGGNVMGFGTVDTPDSAATPLVNNGHIAGNSVAELITLAGYVKGVGTLDNVVITGTDAPGFSPATVNRGSVVYDGTLEIEIGGTTPGSDYDQLNHILGAGIAELGGTLDVELLGGFMPSLGDTFAIITAADVQGMFDTELLPELTTTMQWNVSYQADSVSLSVGLAGDFDFDYDVDGIDFLLWQRDPGVGALADWETNYGTVLTPPLTAVSQAIPEPSTLALTSLCLVGVLHVRRAKL